jgi:hypothetical protein
MERRITLKTVESVTPSKPVLEDHGLIGATFREAFALLSKLLSTYQSYYFRLV